MATYEVETADGVCWRLHIDRLDSEFAWLYRLGPGDQSKWQAVFELRQVPDDA